MRFTVPVKADWFNLQAVQDLSIGRKLILITMVISTLALLLALGGLLVYEQIAFRRNLTRDISSIARIVGTNSTSALVFSDQDTVEETLAALSGKPQIVSGVIYTTEGTVLGRYFRDGVETEIPDGPQPSGSRFGQGHLNLFHEVEFDGEVVGTVYLRSDLSEMQSRRRQYVGIIGFVFIVSGVVAFWLASRLQGPLVEPLSRAVGVAQRVAGGDLTPTIVVDSKDETGQVLLSVEKMVKNLREMIGELKRAASEVAHTATDISAFAEQIQKGAERQSSSTEETSATMVEIASQIDSVARSSQTLAGTVDQSSASIQQMGTSIDTVARDSEKLLSSVEETSATLEEMVASIKSISEKAQVVDQVSQEAAETAKEGGAELSRVVADIGASSRDIGKIVKIVEEIADQTNLLALNAAIVAARSGEAGRGFAVVAEEIRRLAERSVNSTREVSTFIEAVQQDTERAVGLSRSILGKIVDSVTQASELVSEVYTSTQEHSAGATEILKTSEHMKTVIEQLTGAAQEQSLGARQVLQGVEVMNVMTQEVADASNEQKRGGDLVVKAVEEIAQVANQNLVAIEELSQATHSLTEQAERLRSLSEVFTV